MEKSSNVQSDYVWKGAADYIDRWLWMATPYPVLAIAAAYLAFVLYIGPQYMKRKRPYKLNNLIFFYNVTQVVFSFYLMQMGIRLHLQYGLFGHSCILEKAAILQVATGNYWYLTAKFTELFDTVFFVFRKKYNQVSFLHVYHHTLMFLGVWYALKYEPGFNYLFLGTLNSFVHVVMYGYYALSTFPSLVPYLWWKKYITKLQMGQFVLLILQGIINYIISGCKPSLFLFSLVITNLFLMIYLFGDFYIKAYAKGKKNRNTDQIRTETSRIENNNNVNRDQRKQKMHG